MFNSLRRHEEDNDELQIKDDSLSASIDRFSLPMRIDDMGNKFVSYLHASICDVLTRVYYLSYSEYFDYKRLRDRLLEDVEFRLATFTVYLLCECGGSYHISYDALVQFVGSDNCKNR